MKNRLKTNNMTIQETMYHMVKVSKKENKLFKTSKKIIKTIKIAEII